MNTHRRAGRCLAGAVAAILVGGSLAFSPLLGAPPSQCMGPGASAIRGASLRGRPAAASFALGCSSARRGGLRATKPSLLGLRAQQQPGTSNEEDVAAGKKGIDLEMLGRQFEVFKKIAKVLIENTPEILTPKP